MNYHLKNSRVKTIQNNIRFYGCWHTIFKIAKTFLYCLASSNKMGENPEEKGKFEEKRKAETDLPTSDTTIAHILTCN